ncbi:MAG: NFACT RNA binding domain-containing protein [Candidatus Woesearchaeota archaeon]
MDIKLHWEESVEKNAERYYKKAKKLKGKIDGVHKAITLLKDKIKKSERQHKKKRTLRNTKKEWYEKFRWFFTSSGKLCIAGRSAHTNEMVIKRYLENNDIVFHTSLPKSPFAVLKDGENATEEDIDEVSDFVASFSNAWNRRINSSDVFYVNPDQVTKETKAGENMGTGSFMVYGKKNFAIGRLNLCATLMKGKITCAPESACDDDKMVKLIPGPIKVSSIAKKIRGIYQYNNLDEIIRVLPGESKIVKVSVDQDKVNERVN